MRDLSTTTAECRLGTEGVESFEIPMMQLSGPRKRRADQAAIVAQGPPLAPAGVMKLEAEECFGDENAPLHKRVKETQPSPTLQDLFRGILNEPSPLGLRLRKSPSLADLIQMTISQTKSAGGQSAMDSTMSGPPIKKDIKSEALTASEPLKASNFPASFLKIGTWEYSSEYEGDLVAKCYYGKRKLVWEVLYDGLKSKIEIQWAHITALKASFPEEGDGTLDLVLARPPLFFKETDPQPKKHTLWQAASDFTGGQASLHRRHILQCSSTLLSKTFEKLIQCDQRLNYLSQQRDIILGSPIFEPGSSIFENPNESDAASPKFTHTSPCPVLKNGVHDLILQQPEFFAQPMNLEAGVPDVNMDDLVNHLDNCVTEQRTAGNEAPSEEFLEIAQCLFSDAHCPPVSDDKYLMARVDSLCSLLEKDTAPATITIPEHNNGGSIVVGKLDVDDLGAELRSHFENEELRSTPAGENADDTEPTAILRKDSFTELLQNLPRIESVSQFFFDIEEDPEMPDS